jgi:hypothetical protein
MAQSRGDIALELDNEGRNGLDGGSLMVRFSALDHPAASRDPCDDGLMRLLWLAEPNYGRVRAPGAGVRAEMRSWPESPWARAVFREEARPCHDQDSLGWPC